MQDVAHWGVLTIGTGLGNARFSNREPDAADEAAAKVGKTGQGAKAAKNGTKTKSA
jgi:hypothetical protein